MADYRTIPAAELGKGSNIKVELCETEVDLYWKMAIEVLELIQENNAKGEKTVMIVPYFLPEPHRRRREGHDRNSLHLFRAGQSVGAGADGRLERLGRVVVIELHICQIRCFQEKA